jgi:prepilin-type N-terminal cleavage/methylation domain-containing protein
MKRRGFTLWELLAASILLGALATFSLQFLAAGASQRRASHARQTALQEASNVMERLFALRWDDLTPEAARQTKDKPHLSDTLPGGEIEIKIDSPTGTPPAKRITVVVSWNTGGQRAAEPIRLVAWRYHAP